MDNKKYIGARNVGEIIPWCVYCGESLDLDPPFESGWVRHDTEKIECQSCGEVVHLELEYCFFSREKDEDLERLRAQQNNHTMKG